MNTATAQGIVELGRQWYQIMDSMLCLIQEAEDAELQRKMKLALATIATELEVEVMGPAYRVCPGLRPEA